MRVVAALEDVDLSSRRLNVKRGGICAANSLSLSLWHVAAQGPVRTVVRWYLSSHVALLHPDQVCSEWLMFPPVETGWLDSLRSLSPFSSSVSFCVAPPTVTLQYNTKPSKSKLAFQ